MKRKHLVLVPTMLAGLFSVVRAGDIPVGKSIFIGNACIGCHGEGGNSQIDIYPVLAGKPAAYIMEQLTKFRSLERLNATMNAMASGLSDSDISNVAAYLAAQEGPAVQVKVIETAFDK